MRYYLIVILLFALVCRVHSQQGFKFVDLVQRLSPYFSEELINDVRQQLPQGTDYSIWGYDIGDFSNDGFYDLGLSIRLAGDKRKQMQVYLFVDLNGYLTKVAQFSYEYIEIPLEIGIVIRDNICYITKKAKQYNWSIRGYRFINGNLILWDEYKTTRFDNLTKETYNNYFNLLSTERYIRTNDGRERFNTKFMKIPSYPRGRQIYTGYNNLILCNDIDFVHKGAYYWKGENDASFTVKSSYNQNYLYMTINIIDDNVVIPRCDTCPGDYVSLWFDILPLYTENNERFILKTNDKTIKFRTSTELGIYNISFFPGDFDEKKSYYKISSTDDFEGTQKIALRNIKVISLPTDSGFVMKLKIPFSMFGIDESIALENKFTEIGFTIVYHDFDNPFRPEEETEIASSANFSPLNPSSYGALVIIPENMWYGENIYVFRDDIIKILQENGF